MKPLLILTSLGLSLNLIGCQTNLPSNAASGPTQTPLYSQMTDKDVQIADSALQYALESIPSTEKHEWINSRSGNSGTITPLRSYKSVAGYYCRDYQELLRINPRQAVYFDTACRGKNSNWHPI